MPFFLDLPTVAIIILIAEVYILKDRFRLASPVNLFILSFSFLYIFPYLGHTYIEPHRKLRLLDNDQLGHAYNLLRQFFYTWCVITVLLLYRLRRQKTTRLTPDPNQTRNRLLLFTFLFFVFLVVYLGGGVGFHPVVMAQRAFNPRAFTHIKTQLGPLLKLKSLLKFCMLVFSIAYIRASKKSFGSIIIFLLLLLISVMGGTKASLVAPFLLLVVLWQIMSKPQWPPLKSLKYLGLSTFGGFALLLLAFMLLGRPGEWVSPSEALRHLYAYQKECYYVPLVPERFEWSPDRLYTAITDSFAAFVPRAIWKSKPYLGMWTRYFRPAFEPNTVYYHTSTLGCLAEAHMLFGVLGPYIFGLIWAFLTYIYYRLLLHPTSWFRAAVVCSFSPWVYLLLRTGFTGTNFMHFIVGLVFWALCFLGIKSNSANMNLEDNQHSGAGWTCPGISC